MISAADKGRERAKLLRHDEQHLVVIVEAVRDERNELEPRALRAERGGCGRESGGKDGATGDA